MPVGYYYIIIELKDWVLQAHSNILKFYICLSSLHISFWMFQICEFPRVMSDSDTGVESSRQVFLHVYILGVLVFVCSQELHSQLDR
jgi:hypothetical protein